eukprot:CAMPEP_0172088846 /NCGR_PEP_ID=MMETSP1043-20130122/23466_1 /TAXON_ID=464988 /ORGANISM="Hemiselmis andersenii, Strain CCMP441" /LENGTH=38 /DNA_ID= /DNA_START= /DNA_END= /DNA_ORIENTATION=
MHTKAKHTSTPPPIRTTELRRASSSWPHGTSWFIVSQS